MNALDLLDVGIMVTLLGCIGFLAYVAATSPRDVFKQYGLDERYAKIVSFPDDEDLAA